jgi:hypothetical protein
MADQSGMNLIEMLQSFGDFKAKYGNACRPCIAAAVLISYSGKV